MTSSVNAVRNGMTCPTQAVSPIPLTSRPTPTVEWINDPTPNIPTLPTSHFQPTPAALCRRPPLTIKTSISSVSAETKSVPSCHAHHAFPTPPTLGERPLSSIDFTAHSSTAIQTSQPTLIPWTESASEGALTPSAPVASSQSTPNSAMSNNGRFKSSSSAESLELATPVTQMPEISMTHIAFPAIVGVDQLKRPSDHLDSDSMDWEAAKKPRLDKEDDVNVVPDMGLQTRIDDEGEQEIEIGPDGLRSVASCISELIENDEGNPDIKSCRLCILRFQGGYIKEMPKPFLRATQEELVEHLTAEHVEAWITIRRDV
ncbi:hypothetical protein AX17_001368 [Amanita inopinata Kibby_2008]|nr:hypothetical protein AX17_001368 [Amanita inopinata Kibby_2008]